MPITKQTKTSLKIDYAKLFEKESHAKIFVEGLARGCKDHQELKERLERHAAVVNALKEKGVTSFFSAIYSTVFEDPEEACSIRDKLISKFKECGLNEKQTKKMADCIIFSVKNGKKELIERVANISLEALKAGVPFEVVADVVYYSPSDIPSKEFARRCIETSLKKNKTLAISHEELRERLAKFDQRE